MKENEYRIMRAQPGEAEEIYALYHSLIGLPYSTWDEEYPSREIVQEDVTQHAVLTMREGNGRLISAIALRNEFEFGDAAAWYPDVSRWAMLTRLGVAADMQGRGIARLMMAAAMREAKDMGCEAVQFLVAKSNPIAQRAYAPLGFDICGEAELWEPGEVWLCYQKRL